MRTRPIDVMTHGYGRKAIALVFAGASFLGCKSFGENVPRERPSAAAAPETESLVRMGASWAAYYRSMAALKAHSDFAIAGEIASVSAGVRPDSGPVYQLVTVSVANVL